MLTSIRKKVRQLISNTPLYPRVRQFRIYYATRKAQYIFLRRHNFHVENIKAELVKRHKPETVNKELDNWVRAGKPVPPPEAYKQKVVMGYAQKYNVKTLIETGTCIGDMCYAARDAFEKIYSIELSRFLYNIAKQVLAEYRDITLFNGDSSIILPRILSSISEPCIFWLDAHYSGGMTSAGAFLTPITSELNTIALHPEKRHVILIDDARDFTGDDCPTVEYIRQFCLEHFPDHEFFVEDDIMRIAPLM